MAEYEDYRIPRFPKSGHRAALPYQPRRCDKTAVPSNRCGVNEYEPLKTFSFKFIINLVGSSTRERGCVKGHALAGQTHRRLFYQRIKREGKTKSSSPCLLNFQP